ncbi:MAG: HIT domain-containing protein [Chloroflexota bacterium]
MEYIEHHQSDEEGCVFCNLLAQKDGSENLILHRGEHVFVILNRFPYTSGHIMVVPFLHTDSFENLDVDSLTELMQKVTLGMRIIRKLYHPEAFNLGANVGVSAGAGIADHVHMHIVPRWNGDTNFMSTLGQTRVLPEELTETYQRMRSEWDLEK